MSDKYLIIEDYYKALKSMYVDSIDFYNEFTMIKSNVINDGTWNFLCNFKTKDYEIYCKDTWFVTDINQLTLNYKSSLNLKIKLCKSKNDIINTIINGFSTGNDNDPYGDLSPTYRIALEQKIFKENKDYDVLHYIAYYNSEPISIISITRYKNSSIAYLNNLTTLKQYKGKGVAKELLTFIIEELKKINIQTIVFATETGEYTEKYYINLGFQIYEYGYCFE